MPLHAAAPAPCRTRFFLLVAFVTKEEKKKSLEQHMPWLNSQMISDNYLSVQTNELTILKFDLEYFSQKTYIVFFLQKSHHLKITWLGICLG